MSLRTIGWMGLVVLLAAGFCAAQEGSTPGGDAERTQGPAPAKRPARPIDSTGLLEPMTRELELAEDQQVAVKNLLTEYKDRTLEIRRGFKPSAEYTEKMRGMLNELRDARQSGDNDKVQALTNQLKEMRKDQEAQFEPMRKELAGLQTHLHDQLLAVIHPDKHERFERVWDQYMIRRSPQGGMERNPFILRSLIERLPDLTPEQRDKVNELFKQHTESMRSPDPEDYRTARNRLNTVLYDGLMGLLTAEQRKNVEKELKQHPPRPMSRQPGGGEIGGASGDGSDPPQPQGGG